MGTHTLTTTLGWSDRAAVAREQKKEWLAIRALVRQFGVHADQADDLAQEVAVELHRTTSTFDRRALVWGIAKNKAAYHRRAEARRNVVEREVAPLDLPSLPSAEEIAITREPRALLSRAIEELRSTEPELHAAVMLYLEGLTTLAISARLGIPQGTVDSRLFRARRMLGETVRRWNAEHASRAGWKLWREGGAQ